MNTEQPKKVMRDVLIEAIYKKMREDDRIFFVSADFGAPALDKLRADFKDRFINVGIAEQNLVNVATGLAMEGFVVYAYAIAPFLTMRAYEQIRLNCSISPQIRPININLIGVGGGLSYDVAGPTHHCLEDIGIMRILPNMTVFSPSDWKLVENFFEYSVNEKSPMYFRLDGKSVPLIYENVNDLDFKKGFYELVKGDRVCLVSTGFLTHRALKIAKEIPGVGLVDVFVLKPTDASSLFDILKKYDYIITIEEGFTNNGGLGSLISKILRDNLSDIKLKTLGVNDTHAFDLGDRNYLHKLNNLDEESIVKEIKKHLD